MASPLAATTVVDVHVDSLPYSSLASIVQCKCGKKGELKAVRKLGGGL
jgi:hypothetical protein